MEVSLLTRFSFHFILLLKSENIPCAFPVTVYPTSFWRVGSGSFELGANKEESHDQALVQLERLESLPPGGFLSGGG